MSNPEQFLSDPEESPPGRNLPGRPWAQIGLLIANVAFYIAALDSVLQLTGFDIPESAKAIGGLLLLVGLAIYGFSPKSRPESTTPGRAVPYSPWLHRLNLGIFGASISMIMLSMIIPAIDAARRTAQEAERESETVGAELWSTFSSSKSGLVVELPSDWVDATDLDPAYAVEDISRADVGNDLWFFLLSVPKEDVTYASLDAWTEASLIDLTSSFSPSKVVERTEYLSPGRRVIEIRLDGTKDNARLILLMRFIETPDHYVWARTVATRSGFRAHEETLRQIVGSVRREP